MSKDPGNHRRILDSADDLHAADLDLRTYRREILKPLRIFCSVSIFSRIALRSRLTNPSSKPLTDHPLVKPAVSFVTSYVGFVGRLP
jgi:hypothetical protein